MMTVKEQEQKVFEELLKVRSEIEKIVGYKINKNNYKKAIVEMTKRAANKEDILNQMSEESQEKIHNFFGICQQFLGEVIWQTVNDKNIKIFISYKDKTLTSWNIPIDIFCGKEEAYQLSLSMMAKSLTDCFWAYFISPRLRDAVMANDELAVKALYQSFSRPSMTSSLNNLIMLKENFPDFYKYITTKLDIMTVENMQDFIENKNHTKNKYKKK